MKEHRINNVIVPYEVFCNNIDTLHHSSRAYVILYLRMQEVCVHALRDAHNNLLLMNDKCTIHIDPHLFFIDQFFSLANSPLETLY